MTHDEGEFPNESDDGLGIDGYGPPSDFVVPDDHPIYQAFLLSQSQGVTLSLNADSEEMIAVISEVLRTIARQLDAAVTIRPGVLADGGPGWVQFRARDRADR